MRAYLIPSEQKAADDYAISKIGVSGSILMENAASGSAHCIAMWLDASVIPSERPSILVLCGSGNNGGDGFAIVRDASKAGKAAEALKITAPDLKRLGIVDYIIEEPLGGAHRQPLKTAENLKAAIVSNLDRLSKLSVTDLQELRYQKFRKMGVFLEP